MTEDPGFYSRSSLVRNTFRTTAALIVNGSTTLAASLLVGHMAGVAALGDYQSALAVAQIVALLGPAALGSAASTFVAGAVGASGPELGQIVAAFQARRLLQILPGLSFLAALVWAFLGHRAPLDLLAIVCLTIGVSSYALDRGVLYGSGRAKVAVKWDFINSCAGLVAIGVVLLASFDRAFLYLVIGLGYVLYGVRHWPSRRTERLDLATSRDIDRFVLFATIGTVASTGFLNLSVIVARARGGAAGAGHYGAATVLVMPISLLATAVAMVTYPEMSRAVGRHDHEMLRRITDHTTRSIVSVLWPAFTILVVLRYEVIARVWGPSFVKAGPLIPPLLGALLFTNLASPAVNSITSGSAAGARFVARCTSLGFVIGITTWAVLVPPLGVMGVALGFLAGSFVSALLPYLSAWRRQNQEWNSLTSRVGVGSALLSIYVLIQETHRLSSGFDLAATAVFVSGWSVVSRAELRSTLRAFSELRLRK